MKKCHNCDTCSIVKEAKVAKSKINGYTVEINNKVNCNDENVIYLISCKRCPEQYIGETKRKFKAAVRKDRDTVKFYRA